MSKNLIKSLALTLTLLASANAMSTELLVNGGFETGDFTGWTISNTGSGSNKFYISSTTTAPISGYGTPGASSGKYYAVADQNGPGSQTLAQNFTTNAGGQYTLSYDMFVNSHAAFDATNQFGRVDILFNGNVVDNLYLGAPSDTKYTKYSYDISSVVGAGGTYQLRFMSLQNNYFLEQGVDNVSISAVPEPATLALLGFGLAGLAAARRRKQG